MLFLAAALSLALIAPIRHTEARPTRVDQRIAGEPAQTRTDLARAHLVRLDDDLSFALERLQPGFGCAWTTDSQTSTRNFFWSVCAHTPRHVADPLLQPYTLPPFRPCTAIIGRTCRTTPLAVPAVGRKPWRAQRISVQMATRSSSLPAGVRLGAGAFVLYSSRERRLTLRRIRLASTCGTAARFATRFACSRLVVMTARCARVCLSRRLG